MMVEQSQEEKRVTEADRFRMYPLEFLVTGLRHIQRPAPTWLPEPVREV